MYTGPYCKIEWKIKKKILKREEEKVATNQIEKMQKYFLNISKAKKTSQTVHGYDVRN